MLNKKTAYFVPIIAFVYILFFTQSLPILWEGNLFHEGFAKQNVLSLLEQTFSFKGNILEKAEPAYGLYFKLVFKIFGYNFNGFRISKAVIFAITAMILFKINQELFKKTQHAIIATALSALSFPIYIHTMVLDESFIIAEMYKFAAILMFLKDIKQERTNVLHKILILLLTIFAFKTYPPSAAIIGFFMASSFILDRKQVKKYFLLFIVLLALILPFSTHLEKMSGPFGAHWENLQQVFTKDLTNNLISPFKAIDFSEYTFRALYWKALPNIITFFGFWTIILSLAITAFNKYFQKQEQLETPFKLKFKKIFWLCIIWIICELPIFIYVPEPAIRYASAIITPLSILFVSHIAKAQSLLNGKILVYSKYLLYFTIAFIILTNLLNTFFFRALLGSDIIAMDKVSQIVEKDRHNCILYAPTYAEQYVIVDKTNNNYDIKTDIKRIKATTKQEFSEQNFKEQKKQCNRLFIVQQKAITRNVLFPPIDFTKYKNMKLVKQILGENDSFFDKFYFMLKSTFNTKNLYNEYYLWEYVE